MKKILILILILAGISGYFYSLRVPGGKINPVIEQNAMALDTVRVDNSDFYPEYLPYVSPNVLPLMIDLPNGQINPADYQPLFASGFHNDYMPVVNRLYMIQFKSSGGREKLTGITPIREFAQNTFITEATPDKIKSLREIPDVNFIESYHPQYKLSPEVVQAFYNVEIFPETRLKLVFAPAAPYEDIRYIIDSNNAKAVSVSAEEKSYVISGISDRHILFNLAQHPLITEIGLP